MKILFRSDASTTIGTGHIMRDLVLAKQYSKHKIYFATLNLEDHLKEKIKRQRYEVVELKSNNIIEIIRVIKMLNIDLLIIDNYDISYEDEKRIKAKNNNLKILSFDDTYQKHYCDILLNHNIYADKNKYKKLVPEFCEIRCGSQYTLLREEFYEAKALPKNKNSNFTFFLAMGGSDTANLNISILEVLEKFHSIKVNVVTTSTNAKLDTLKKYCKKKDWIDLHIDIDSIAMLMHKSDFGIITPSVIANEAYFMEMPFMAIQTAYNQIEMANFLIKKDYCVLKEFSKDLLSKKILDVIN